MYFNLNKILSTYHNKTVLLNKISDIYFEHYRCLSTYQPVARFDRQYSSGNAIYAEIEYRSTINSKQHATLYLQQHGLSGRIFRAAQSTSIHCIRNPDSDARPSPLPNHKHTSSATPHLPPVPTFGHKCSVSDGLLLLLPGLCSTRRRHRHTFSRLGHVLLRREGIAGISRFGGGE